MQAIRKINLNLAATITMALLSCAVVFHVLVLTGIVPFNIVWGGRLENATQMYVFESVSLLINLIIIVVVGMKAGYIRPLLSETIVNRLLWAFVVLFSLNTVGNYYAESLLEMLFFTPLTLLCTILFYRIVIESPNSN